MNTVVIPEYIIESYLLTFEMLNQPDKANIEQLIKKGEELESQYLDRHKFWSENLTEGEMKKILVVDSYNPAIQFFNVRDKEFIPAIQEGDKIKATNLLEFIDEYVIKDYEILVNTSNQYSNDAKETVNSLVEMVSKFKV